MSWREHWSVVRSSIDPGSVIRGCRDNDSRTYRLFINRECCDLSVDDLRALVTVLQKAITEHQPWLED